MSLEFACQFRRPAPGGFSLDAAFSIDGGVTALCGPSGSGKTTLVQLLAGLLTPDTGRIVLEGRVLFDRAAKTKVVPEERNLGVVFQDNLLFPHLTAAENLRFGLVRRSERPVAPVALESAGGAGVAPVTFERVVEVLELTDVLAQRPATLSGGQARRVALGRALLCSPALLLLDEPFTGLEDELKDRILTYLERVRDEWRIPMLLVSHDRTAVGRLAGRVLELRGGVLKKG
ncbi:MAG TPA: ATP-binding cassette domain-containing protein [Planctomycetota bacterium]|nr:ATP-binding cassette domain-containing protein [Planctomycetota bacterium]